MQEEKEIRLGSQIQETHVEMQRWWSQDAVSTGLRSSESNGRSAANVHAMLPTLLIANGNWENLAWWQRAHSLPESLWPLWPQLTPAQRCGRHTLGPARSVTSDVHSRQAARCGDRGRGSQTCPSVPVFIHPTTIEEGPPGTKCVNWALAL